MTDSNPTPDVHVANTNRNAGLLIGTTLLLAVIVVILFLSFGASHKSTPAPSTTTTVSSTTTTTSPSRVVSYAGLDGVSALKLLQAQHHVDLKHLSYGDMVVGIDGVKPGPKEYWAFFVNGKLSDKGADQYITKTGDGIRWELTKF